MVDTQKRTIILGLSFLSQSHNNPKSLWTSNAHSIMPSRNCGPKRFQVYRPGR